MYRKVRPGSSVPSEAIDNQQTALSTEKYYYRDINIHNHTKVRPGSSVDRAEDF